MEEIELAKRAIQEDEGAFLQLIYLNPEGTVKTGLYKTVKSIRAYLEQKEGTKYVGGR